MRTPDNIDTGARSLRIVHLLRAPVGGLFRHVMDVAAEQAARGHQVGLIADSTTGGETAQNRLSKLAPSLKLGLTRFPMRREPDPSDMLAVARIYRQVLRTQPDVLHGHGSKGGFYARAMGFLPCPKRILRVYTPHGGSFHRQPGHSLYMAAEKWIGGKTDLLLFESDYIARQFAEGVGETGALRRVAKNGLRPEEFTRVASAPGAAEFLYIGELSVYKGVDTLIDAVAAIHAEGQFKPRLAIVGSGAEYGRLGSLIERRQLSRHVALHGALPAREAFTLGHIVVAPSRAESLPYVVMEAIAAGKTTIATNVGGVPEIFGPYSDRLVPPDQPKVLAQALLSALRQKMAADERTTGEAADETEREALARYVATHFSIRCMVDSVLAAYAQGLSRLANPRATGAEAIS